MSKPEDVIHVCYALYDEKGGFSKIVGTSMLSLFANTKASVVIHLLTDRTLTKKNAEKFQQLASSYGQSIHFYDMTERLAREHLQERMPVVLTSRFSPAALYRLFLAEVLPADVRRVIYADADLIFQRDVVTLWQEPLDGAGLGAVSEQLIAGENMVPKFLCQQGLVPQERYFNSGMLLIDVDWMRGQKDLAAKGFAMLEKYPACDCFDQDILNYFYAAVYHPLPLCYNTFVVKERLENHMVISPVIYHYAGAEIDMLQDGVFMQLWLSYFIRSPWFDVQTLQGAFRMLTEVSRSTQAWDRQRVNSMQKGRRVFWGDAIDRQLIDKFFALSEEDVCLDQVRDADGVYQAASLFQDMKMRKGQGRIYVLLLKPKLYREISAWLQEKGFVEYQDFFNGMDFLPAEIGGTMGLNGAGLFSRL